MKPRNSHVWDRQATDWYVEPEWCSERLFDEEEFDGAIHDPAAGMGRIVMAAHKHGYSAIGTDIHPRTRIVQKADFFKCDHDMTNTVTNPPFKLAQEFALRALHHTRRKVAVIFPVARLNAAHWLDGSPLERIWLLTPRPSMPPGESILNNIKPGGGKVDFCWLVFNKQKHVVRRPELRWLHREGNK